MYDLSQLGYVHGSGCLPSSALGVRRFRRRPAGVGCTPSAPVSEVTTVSVPPLHDSSSSAVNESSVSSPGSSTYMFGSSQNVLLGSSITHNCLRTIEDVMKTAAECKKKMGKKNHKPTGQKSHNPTSWGHREPGSMADRSSSRQMPTGPRPYYVVNIYSFLPQKINKYIAYGLPTLYEPLNPHTRATLV